MNNNQLVFVSYAHADDEYSGGAITHLAQRLQLALKATTGEDLEVFIDRKSIEWGRAWRTMIDQGLAASSVLLVVATPCLIKSKECQAEVQAFLAGGNGHRCLLPLYYYEIDDLDSRIDPISKMIRNLQREEWLDISMKGHKTGVWAKRIHALAKKIMARLHSERQVEAADIPIASTQPPRCYRAQSKEPNLIAAEWSDFTILALAACEKEEYGLARALLLEALDHSWNPELLYELAIVDWLDGALDAAIVGFEQSMGMGLDRVTVLHGLGQARIEQGNYDQGIADLTTVISEHPDELARAYARSTRALGFGGIRRFDEALRELNEAERKVSGNSWLHFNRARILDWQQDINAVQHYLLSLAFDAPPLNRPKREMAQKRIQALKGVSTLIPLGGTGGLA